MSAYYNEFDPFAAAWLRELIKDNLIPEGEVDERSITEVSPDDLKEFTQCHFFAGIGGWSAALRLAGWADSRPVWTGSPPCQPFSVAGNNKAQDDERHLWPVFFNLIRECQPPTVFGEQVASAIRHEWFDDLQANLEKQNYATAMVVLPACSVGAPQKRDRLWFAAQRVANTLRQRQQGSREMERPSCAASNKDREVHRVVDASGGCSIIHRTNWTDSTHVDCLDSKTRTIPTEPALFPLVDGIPNRVGILRGAGNAIVPQVGAEVIKVFMKYKDD
jgi:DNA (cytosine-5)-methyltransferase 1